MGSCVCFKREGESEIVIKRDDLKMVREKAKPVRTRNYEQEFAQLIDSLSLNSEAVEVAFRF